jgi:phosphoenolpyruvate carboxykinase (GTP)
MAVLEKYLNDDNLRKLLAIPLRSVHDFVADSIKLCEPMKIFVCDDSSHNIEYIRKTAILLGEETKLMNPRHTVHFDGFFDQARDKRNTVYLVPKGEIMDEHLVRMDRDEGLALVRKRMKGCMKNKIMIIRFFCLGPLYSDFSIPCVQITDSFYVAHSEDILYWQGYEFFKNQINDPEIFWTLHSSGKLLRSVSNNWKNRGIAIDYKKNTVYSYNTQYAGNSIGLKKLALRLAIRKADREGWLAEHMFLLAVNGSENRKTYMAGAFPSGCGKTSTSMMPGVSIVGDDLIYIRNFKGVPRAANVERGIFGIIKSVNEKNDPLIWEVLHSNENVIFSNVLVHNGIPYWLDDGREPPKCGINHSYLWYRGKVDDSGEEIPLSHENARYTVSLEGLSNIDEILYDPNGVILSGIIFGGRDPDTWVPVKESFGWAHGVITMGASLESETTATTLGPSGVRKLQAFSNMDFISIPLGRYISNYLAFGEKLISKPKIFSVNYFLQNSKGEYLNKIEDKRVWLQWMELRIHNQVKAIQIPTGHIPIFDDLNYLFEQFLGKPYSLEEYEQQFTLRISKHLAKIERIQKVYNEHTIDTPKILYHILNEQRNRLLAAQSKHGDIVSPMLFSNDKVI